MPGLGILLINTGTPSSTEISDISEYLKEFFMDPAIIGAPKPIRRMISNCISKSRPKLTQRKYIEFWTEDGSPFMNASIAQARGLKNELERRGHSDAHVELAMRYGKPSIASGLANLKSAGCSTLIVLPCYPQYANVCAGTCIKKTKEELTKLIDANWNPELICIESFYSLKSYRNALAESVRSAWTYSPNAKLILSFHSTLMADIEQGDPYRDQVNETRANLAQDLGLQDEDVLACFQSRFDTRKWVGPFTTPTLEELVSNGTRDICVICPGFTASNLETHFEIDMDLKSAFEKACNGSCSFTHAPELNGSHSLVLALADAVELAMAN